MITPVESGQDPGLYRVIDDDGSLLPGREPDGLSEGDWLAIYRAMARVRAIDTRMITLQRQGRISFYGAATGQEAAVIGSGYALAPDDWVVPALREGGIALLRGLSLDAFLGQLFGNAADPEHGRQMPCHYGSVAHRYVTLSSVLANQLPHAVGIALAARHRGERVIAAGYLGDGASSEGDVHVAMGFAARLSAPVLFFCQNNQWAISTSFERQTAARCLAIRARGYGMPGYRVDGNDALAVYAVTRHVVAQIRETGRPAFVEAMTYRIGPHSTSDDPSRYRDESVTEAWRARDPIIRFRRALEQRGLFSEEDEETMQESFASEIRAAVQRAEATPPPPRRTLIEGVYAEVPDYTNLQYEELVSR